MSIVLFTSCGNEGEKVLDELQGNEYKIKVNGQVYEEGRNMFAGIASDLTDEDVIMAGFGSALGIYFKKENYVVGKTLRVSLVDQADMEAYTVGVLVLNKDTGNEDIFSIAAVEGTAKIESKKKIEFNLTCYDINDLTYDDNLNYTGPRQGAEKYVIIGYVTEQSPE